jgi:hypothetical protein
VQCRRLFAGCGLRSYQSATHPKNVEPVTPQGSLYWDLSSCDLLVLWQLGTQGLVTHL